MPSHHLFFQVAPRPGVSPAPPGQPLPATLPPARGRVNRDRCEFRGHVVGCVVDRGWQGQSCTLAAVPRFAGVGVLPLRRLVLRAHGCGEDQREDSAQPLLGVRCGSDPKRDRAQLVAARLCGSSLVGLVSRLQRSPNSLFRRAARLPVEPGWAFIEFRLAAVSGQSRRSGFTDAPCLTSHFVAPPPRGRSLPSSVGWSGGALTESHHPGA